MRISRARGWLAVAAIALQSTEAAFVTFTSGFSDNPDDSIAVIYAQALKVFDWTTDPGVTVSEIKLFSVDGNGKETLISSKQKSGSADLAQTATTSTSGPATTTTIGSKNGRSIEDGAAGGRDTRTLVLDCEHHSPLGPGNKTLACVGGALLTTTSQFHRSHLCPSKDSISPSRASRSQVKRSTCKLSRPGA